MFASSQSFSKQDLLPWVLADFRRFLWLLNSSLERFTFLEPWLWCRWRLSECQSFLSLEISSLHQYNGLRLLWYFVLRIVASLATTNSFCTADTKWRQLRLVPFPHSKSQRKCQYRTRFVSIFVFEKIFYWGIPFRRTKLQQWYHVITVCVHVGHLTLNLTFKCVVSKQ